MEAAFWHDRWQQGRIGFHQSETNDLLVTHWPKLAADAPAGSEVFVPLCGKSLDMVWLAGAGTPPRHHVIGVELSPIAIADFFAGPIAAAVGGTPARVRRGGFEVYASGPWELWCGDFFAFPADRLAQTRLAYDRASLIALPPEMRPAYARKLHELLPPDARMLLISLSYDETEMDGPPFSVPDEEVFDLFAGTRRVERMETRDTLAGDPRMRERGLSRLQTSVFAIGPALV